MSIQGAVKKETIDESPAAPDSTTKERSGFSEGEDVLFQHKDGRYYLGTVVEVDLVTERCLIKFGDDTESWSSFKDLTKLSLPESDLLCVICKKSQPKTDNEIIVCDKCGRGYHQLCHQPHIPKDSTKAEVHWVCKRCLENMPGKAREKFLKKESTRKMCSGNILLPTEDDDDEEEDCKLPYDMDELSWDLSHRSNLEQIYCYCGKNGEWFMQMLQCGRCRQWFHEKCIKCLQYPLYCGDRFYVFVCSLCNYGKEFVRRLEMKWVDIVHLALFNLTIFNAKKYYDLDTAIVPYVNKHWNSFQLPPKILDVSPEERRDNILSVLTNNRNRFKCGREIKKRTTIWGLRARVPPHAPSFTLPSVRPVNDALLKELWFGNKRLKFLPPSLSSLASGKCQLGKSLRNEGVLNGHTSMMKSAMTSSVTGNSSGSTMSSYPSMNHSVMGHQGSQMHNNSLPSTPAGVKLLHINIRPEGIREKVCIKSSEYCTGGFAKKSTSYPPANRLSVQHALLRRRLKNINSSSPQYKEQKERLLKQRRYKTQQIEGQAKEFTARKARKLLKNAIATSQKSTQDLPPTPPSSSTTEVAQPSVSGSSSATTPVPSGPGRSASGGSLSAPPSTSAASFPPPITPGDTSGDETSSRGTLDSFIPPPKDFEGGGTQNVREPEEAKGVNGIVGAGWKEEEMSTAAMAEPLPITAGGQDIISEKKTLSVVPKNVRKNTKKVNHGQFKSAGKGGRKRKLDEVEYEVEKILDHRKDEGRGILYLVKWKGWSLKSSTWEPAEHLNCKRCLVAYKEKLARSNPLGEPTYEMIEEFINTLISPTKEDFERLMSIFRKKNFVRYQVPDETDVERKVRALLKIPDKSLWDKEEVDELRKILMVRAFHFKRVQQLTDLEEWEVEIAIISTDSGTISIENNVDLECSPPNFNYVNDYIPGNGVTIPEDPPIGCECSPSCSKASMCCGVQSGSSFAYAPDKRLIVPVGTPIYECNKRCSCDENCNNRVIQNGRHIDLCIFRTSTGCGWGVKALEPIKKGTFVCEYVGEVIASEEAELRGQRYDAEGRTYLFDLDYDSEQHPFTVDGAHFGNVSHFINHSCEPNLAVFAVWFNCLDPSLPKLALFATRNIKAGEEITFDYNCQTIRANNSNSPKENELISETAFSPRTSPSSARLMLPPSEISESNLPESENLSNTSFRTQCKCNAKSCRKYLF